MLKILNSLVVVFILAVVSPRVCSAEIAVGDPAPDFSLIDSNETQRSLSEFQGKYVVLEWFNPQCPFVRNHYDSENMQNLQKKYTSQDVTWLSINSSAEGKQGNLSPEGARQFIAAKNVSSTAVLLDPDGNAGNLYGAKTTPHMFIIDPDGKLIYQGAIDDMPSTDPEDIVLAKNYVDDTLSSVLAGQPVAPFSTKSYGCSVKY